MATGRVAAAEPYFKQVAATAETAAAKLTLAQYYVVANQPGDARRVLQALAKESDSCAAATERLAALDAVDGNRALAQTEVPRGPGEIPQGRDRAAAERQPAAR